MVAMKAVSLFAHFRPRLRSASESYFKGSHVARRQGGDDISWPCLGNAYKQSNTGRTHAASQS